MFKKENKEIDWFSLAFSLSLFNVSIFSSNHAVKWMLDAIKYMACATLILRRCSRTKGRKVNCTIAHWL